MLNEDHRSTQFVPAKGDSLLCDNGLASGWYKFKDGNEMPTTCVDTFHCGTNAPIWMKGTHPTVAQGEVSASGCVNYGANAGSFGAPCCHLSIPIRVKNCGSFYVYHLTRTPGCAMGYCAGKLVHYF